MSICLTQFLGEHGVLVITISLTLAALGFSIFGSIYSNLIHNAEMAKGNALQCNGISKAYWLQVLRNFRRLARSRAITTNLCFWSLVLIIIALIMFVLPLKNSCSGAIAILVTFFIALALLITALLFAGLLVGYKRRGKLIKCLLKLWCIRHPISPNPPRLPEDC